MAYFELKRPNGKDNMGGYSVKAWLAPLADFQTIKGLKAPGAPGDSVTINGSHVFNATKGWIPVYSTLKSAKTMMEAFAEIGVSGAKVTGELFRPGTSKLDAEFARQAQNEDFILLLKDINNHSDGSKRFLQFGSEEIPVAIKVSHDSATVDSGKKGFTFKIETYQLGLQFYEGTDPDTALAANALPSAISLDDAATFVD